MAKIQNIRHFFKTDFTQNKKAGILGNMTASMEDGNFIE